MTTQEAIQTLGLSAVPATRDELRAALERKLTGGRALLARSAASVNRDQVLRRLAGYSEAYAVLGPLVAAQQPARSPTAQPSPPAPSPAQARPAPVARPTARHQPQRRQGVAPRRVTAPATPPPSALRPAATAQAAQGHTATQTHPTAAPVSQAPSQPPPRQPSIQRPPYRPPYGNWAQTVQYWWNRIWRGDSRYAALALAILMVFVALRGWTKRDDDPVPYVYVAEPARSAPSATHAAPRTFSDDSTGERSSTLTIPVAPVDPEIPSATILLPEAVDNLVWILCHPVADVYVDGAYAGESPRPKPFLVSRGTHTIQVIPKGDSSVRRFDVSLSPDRPYVIEVLLDEGRVSINEGVVPWIVAK